MAERKIAEAFHPGEYLSDELEARGWSQVEFAQIIGRPARLVNEIVNKKRGITPATAKELAAALGTSAQYWMNLDSFYQLWKTDPVAPGVYRQAKMRSRFPVREMVLRSWLEDSENPQVLESRLLRFFEIGSLDEEPRHSYAAKQSGDTGHLTPIQAAWLYRVKHIADSMQVPRFSEKRLRNAVEELKALREAPEEIRRVPEILSACGVRFVIVEPFPSSKIDGVCLWLNAASPVIGMTLRFDRIDNFWFVLRHEIEHVLNGDGKDAAIVDSDLAKEGAPVNKDISREESLANAAAEDFCTPAKELIDFIARVGPLYYRTKVVAFARRLHLHPGLVVGQLQRRTGRYELFRPLLVPIRSFITPVAMADGYGHAFPVKA